MFFDVFCLLLGLVGWLAVHRVPLPFSFFAGLSVCLVHLPSCDLCLLAFFLSVFAYQSLLS